jgi:multiple sugar transport system permease protein
MGLHNTYFSLIIPNLAVPLGTILMTQFLIGVPKEFEEAAQIDGANRWYIFSKIMIPIARPALSTLAIITFLATWNSYLWPLVTTQETDMFTITVGLASSQQGYFEESLGSIMAQGVIASFPVVLLFLIFQKNLVKGIVVQSK